MTLIRTHGGAIRCWRFRVLQHNNGGSLWVQTTANIVRRELEIFDTIAVGVCMSFVFRLFSTRWQRISRMHVRT